MRPEDYRYVATSRTGFVQQVVCSYVRHGYRFYVSGRVPDGKDPKEVDEKLLNLYDIRKTDRQRYRAKKRGEANLQYIRFEHDWLMLATAGNHEWKTREKGNIRDCSHGQPIMFRGYSISLKKGLYRPVRCKRERGGPKERDDKMRVRVQIARSTFRDLKAEFIELAKTSRVDRIGERFFNLEFEPYAPIRQQSLTLLFCVNQLRKRRGYSKINSSVIRYRRKIVRPFVA